MAMTTQAINASAPTSISKKSFIPLIPECFTSSIRSETEEN